MFIEILALSLAFFVIGPIMVDIGGYFWHRFVEHDGVFGDTVRYRHVVHHEEDYPINSLRPDHQYKSAKSWSWFILGALLIISIFLVFPLRIAVFASVGGVIYARWVINYFHSLFHSKNHWIHSFGWFNNLIIYHDIHHWERANYGIVSMWLDRIFGTFKKDFPEEKQDIFPGFRMSAKG